MQRITSSKLAELLQNGFEGEIQFSGRAFCRIEDVSQSTTFYESSGKFSLTQAGRDCGVEEGSYLLTNTESRFFFKPEERRKIRSESRERYGDIIAFPIDFPAKAVLQIEPKEIIF
jgi:hypothetical protein